MLAITDNAVDAIRRIVSAPEVVEGAGLRIATQPDSGEQDALEVSIAAVPAASDEIVDDRGARVFVEHEASLLLEDKLLDAQIDGARVGFTISDRA